MRKRNIIRLEALLLAVVLVVLSFNTNIVKADADEEFAAALATALGRPVTDTDKLMYSTLIKTMEANGYSGAAIAGVCGNIACESGGSIFSIECHSNVKCTAGISYTNFQLGGTYEYTYSGNPPYFYYKDDNGNRIVLSDGRYKCMTGVGHGIIQWSFGRAEELDKFALSDALGYVTVKHGRKTTDEVNWSYHTCHIPDAASQVVFLLTKDTGFSSEQREHLKGITSIDEAARYFCDKVEKPANPNYNARCGAAARFVDAIQKCPGIIGNIEFIDPDATIGLIGSGIENSEYWSPEEKERFYNLVSESELTGLPSTWSAVNSQSAINLRTKWDLSLTDRITLTSISEGIKSGDINAATVATLISFILGYIVLVYAFLLLLAFFFDKVNNFIDIELVTILTFGKISIVGEVEDIKKSRHINKKWFLTTWGYMFVVLLIFIMGISIISGFIPKLIYRIFYSIFK